MAVDFSEVRNRYMAEMQEVCLEMMKLCNRMDNLDNLYVGSGLSGAFEDTDMVGNFKHMAPADVGTFTSNLNTIRAAVTAAILKNLEKCAGRLK